MSHDNIFNLNDDELTLAQAKNSDKNRLGFAILLKYFQLESHYPKDLKYIDTLMLTCIANQLNVSTSCIDDFDWEGRSTKRFRTEIRNLLGYKKATLDDVDKLKEWLIKNVFPNNVRKSQRIEHAYEYFQAQRIEPFTSKELMKYIQSAHQLFEQQLFDSIHTKLLGNTKQMMDLLLIYDSEIEENDQDNNEFEIRFRHLKQDIPGAKLKNVALAIQKVNYLKKLRLPKELLSNLSSKLINKYYTRVLTEHPLNIRRHEPPIRYGIFSLFCYLRSQLLTDGLADLLIQLIHKIRTSAENSVDKKILSEVKRVNGKFDILCSLSMISIENPTGIIQEEIYPTVPKETLCDIVKEHNSKGRWYEHQVHKKMHSVYSHAHRKILLTLLEAFVFETNVNDSKPLLEAIKIIIENRDSSDRYYPKNVLAPIKNVISSEWDGLVVFNEKSGKKIHRVNYEIAVLQELRRQLSCKMIWIEGAFRYRNPHDDLPKDFEEKREHYYNLLGLPINARDFTEPRKKQLHEGLKALNDTILENDKVEILDKNGGHIKISPYDPQAEPPNIKKLHEAIKKEYGTISLIDVLKESELDIGFTKKFHSSATRESLSREILQFRLLLCFYGIGTNTGLKCISASNDDVKYADLKYVKRRYITVEDVRQAIVEVVNKNLEIRDPRIWGTATTGVACDSKKISVWDQNLMVEYHARYKGRGVMVYWHVEKKALCIYSQLKTCSSSEVGSMIKGILDHCTKMEVNKAYMDTHGQSTLGFGIGELLSFDLLPRLKNIHEQKLYYPSVSKKDEYKNLETILRDSIDWKLIEDNYDEAVKYAVALKTGTMEPDVFVKRFSSDNYQHPIYKTIVEIGKIGKTNFLCRYLMIEELRIEVHEAQNVVERLNSIMGFIFYGKLGEISTNIRRDQELAIVCLHLLQACMAYVNTVIFQNILSRPEWKNVLTPEDKRALNVLFHSHLNPYGLFPLDLSTRLGITDGNSAVLGEDQAIEAIEEEEFV
ncbi:MAG: Tn3 family transposase [Gammaproteobacteria bacterium CG_4_10_14_0_8_um_filter_38_16]|nr:MAG: Tn3 family transposase [Gammaproteobacteria bacterium CG_4_10_14_0_8_um_filter_38_16]PJA03008.1 MAG: Tn3 family transposase [Gammaproteobacteria bacterium CG_4_10_14_0_2_um_filter_38_22]PJB09773.1 MAG: Tn3 family transposase [Gammaproteobacteria bacterium CG_4_9_14_3_um_filter_38_9]